MKIKNFIKKANLLLEDANNFDILYDELPSVFNGESLDQTHLNLLVKPTHLKEITDNTNIIMFFFDFNPITKVFSFYPEYNFNNIISKINTNNLNFNTLLYNIQFFLQFTINNNYINITDNKFTLTIML